MWVYSKVFFNNMHTITDTEILNDTIAMQRGI
jgi:hypothetical protein